MMNASAPPPGSDISVAPPIIHLGLVGWLRRNLFNSWFNALLSLAAIWLISHVVFVLIRWALFQAGDPKTTVTENYKDDCLGCHVPAQDNDWVYVEGYPVLEK